VAKGVSFLAAGFSSLKTSFLSVASETKELIADQDPAGPAAAVEYSEGGEVAEVEVGIEGEEEGGVDVVPDAGAETLQTQKMPPQPTEGEHMAEEQDTEDKQGVFSVEAAEEAQEEPL